MAKNSQVKVIYGPASLQKVSEEDQKAVFDILTKHKVTMLDTASSYPGSEAHLGRHNAGSRFEIHTKAPAQGPGYNTKEGILTGAAQSFSDLKMDSVEIYYIHRPSPHVPISSTLEGIQELYKAGKFRRFGLSNFSAEQLQEVLDYTEKHGYVKPTVYEGNYNPVARHLEDEIIPLCRKHGISFYGYSPMAGSFLTMSPQQIEEGQGRFGQTDYVGLLYNSLYKKPALTAVLSEWEQIANDAGISKAALAYRWVVWHSALSAENGDGIILSGKTPKRLDDNLSFIEEGPLPGDTADRVSAIWEKVKHEAPSHNTEGITLEEFAEMEKNKAQGGK